MLSEIRKEIEKHRVLIGNDRGEERAFRRNLALRESIKRAEEENEEMTKSLADLQGVPDKMKPEWEAKKKQWQSEKRRLAAAQEKAAKEKALADRQAMAVESEVATLLAKKEKMLARLTKLRVDLGRLDSENSEGSETKEKKQAEREASEKHRQQLEQEYLDAIHRLETRINDYSVRSHENWATYYALENAALQQQQLLQQQADLASMIMADSHPVSSLASLANRERSSSMFSDGSVVTNLSDLGNSGFVPAFEPIVSRHGSGEYSPMAVGRGGKVVE